MNILVTGGLGYFGSKVVKELELRNHMVTIFDNDYYDLGTPGKTRKLIKDDVYNIDKYDLSIYDAVVALAAIVGDEACQYDPEETKRINLDSVDKLVQQDIERLVFASTCSVYGKGDGLMNEESETKPLSLYAEVKKEAESLVLATEGCPTVLRFPTFFGFSTRPRFDLVVNLFIAQAYFDKKLTVNGDGKQVRPFCHVKDGARGVADVVEAPKSKVSNQIFNLGGVNYTIAEIAEKIGEHFPGTTIELAEGQDQRDYLVDFSKIKSQLGFTTNITLEDSIEEFRTIFNTGFLDNYKDSRFSNYKRLTR